MTATTPSDLLVLAQKNLDEAQAILGLPQPETSVSGDSWTDVARRAAELLKRAWDYPRDLGSRAATKIRDAARSGLDKASDATADARATLGKVAMGAGLLAAMPGVMLGLLAFALVEGTGYGARARGAGRRYVDRRLAAYGF